MVRMLACILAALLALPVRGAEPERYAALTFEDGPSGACTRQLLEGLAYRGAAATFLLCGYRLSQQPGLGEEILRGGHEIGLHGYSHGNMRHMSRRDIGKELADCQALLPPGCTPVLFRPPGGVVTDGIRQVARARQLALLRWSLDPGDYGARTPEAIREAVLAHTADGDILRLRDLTRESVETALEIVDGLQQQGFRLVTVSELARLRRIPLRPGAVYAALPPGVFTYILQKGDFQD